MKKTCEYFYKSCGQLGLYLKDEKFPTECGNCCGSDLVVGAVGTLNKEELFNAAHVEACGE